MQIDKTIIFCLQNYNNISSAVEEARLDPNTPKQGGGGRCRISDPTAMLAIRNLQEIICVKVFYGAKLGGKRNFKILYYPERWLKVIDSTREQYYGLNDWDAFTLYYIDGLKRAEIIKKLKVGSTTYHSMINGVFCFAAGVAKGLDLIPKSNGIHLS